MHQRDLLQGTSRTCTPLPDELTKADVRGVSARAEVPLKVDGLVVTVEDGLAVPRGCDASPAQCEGALDGPDPRVRSNLQFTRHSTCNEIFCENDAWELVYESVPGLIHTITSSSDLLWPRRISVDPHQKTKCGQFAVVVPSSASQTDDVSICKRTVLRRSQRPDTRRTYRIVRRDALERCTVDSLASCPMMPWVEHPSLQLNLLVWHGNTAYYVQ